MNENIVTQHALMKLLDGSSDFDSTHQGSEVQLKSSQCLSCNFLSFPVRKTCERCSHDTQEVALSTYAILRGLTHVIHPPPGAEVEVPYGVGFAEFPEGLCIIGLIAPQSNPQTEIGMSVRTVAHEAFSGFMTYAYEII